MMLKRKIELLAAEFTREILRALGSAALGEVSDMLAGARRRSARAQPEAPPSAPEARRTARAKAKPRASTRTGSAPHRPTPTGAAAPADTAERTQQIEDLVLRVLLEGEELTSKGLAGFGALPQSEAPLVRAAVDSLVAKGVARMQRRGRGFTVTAARAETASTAPSAPEKPRPAGKKPKAAQSTRRRRPPGVQAKHIEEQLLRQLRSGMLLSPAELVEMVHVTRAAPAEMHAALERLVTRGIVGVLGEGADRLVFFETGRGGAAVRTAAQSEAAPAPTASGADLAPVAATTDTTEDVAPTTTTISNASDGGHPLVQRRKKAAEAAL